MSSESDRGLADELAYDIELQYGMTVTEHTRRCMSAGITGHIKRERREKDAEIARLSEDLAHFQSMAVEVLKEVERLRGILRRWDDFWGSGELRTKRMNMAMRLHEDTQAALATSQPTAAPADKSCETCEWLYHDECEHDGDCIDWSAWKQAAPTDAKEDGADVY